MKKILLFSLVIIVIPTIMTTIIKKEDKNDFIYEENMLIRVKRKNGNVEVIPLEKYIVGVLAGEMPLNFTDEALKAQAIAPSKISQPYICHTRSSSTLAKIW